MSSGNKHNIRQSQRRNRWSLLCLNLVLASVIILLLSIPRVRERLSLLSFEINLATRDLIGLTPRLDPKIKILAYDDQVAAMLKTQELPLDGWAFLINALKTKPPKRIYIDKIFGYTTGKKQLPSLIEALNTSPSQVVVGAFCAEQPIPGRLELSATSLGQQSSGLLLAKDYLGHCPYLYGPDQELREVFAGIGHISLSEGQKFYPMLVSERDGLVLPSLGLWGQGAELTSARTLRIGDKVLQLDPLGRMWVDLPKMGDLLDRFQSLQILLRDGPEKEKFLNSLGPEDLVLILPSAYTGNADFKETVQGTILGGFLHAAILNSQLTGRWLSDLSNSGFVLFGVFLLAIGLGFLRNKFGFLGVMSLSVLGIALASGVMFSSFGLQWNWVEVELILVLTAGVNFIQSYRQREIFIQRLIQTMGGSLSQTRIQELVRHPEHVFQKPEEREMTILFLDMVGFSLVADKKPPAEVFNSLKQIFQSIEVIVHKHQGVIDKILGDGLLCFFGYDLNSDDHKQDDHALRAVQCALDLQIDGARRVHEAHTRGELQFPYRIGLNTASVYFGDLGGDDRIEFTCIGQGVNFAARLETGCETFRVLLGEATYERLPKTWQDRLQAEAKLIQIKHYSSFFPSYELDPLRLEPGLYERATLAYRRSAKIVRREARFAVPDLRRPWISTSLGLGRIRDFSKGGLAIEWEGALYGKGVLMELEFSLTHQDGAKPESWRFSAEVRSSSRYGSLAVHRVQIKTLADHDAELWWQALRGRFPEAEMMPVDEEIQ